MFRDHKARGTPSARRSRRSWTPGGLVTDDITNEMVKERVGRPDVAPGFILDGYPRTAPQAQYLDSCSTRWGAPSAAASPTRSARTSSSSGSRGRRCCPKCGAVYHVSQNPPKRDGFCDRDDAGLLQRDDDKPENVRKRLHEYAVKTEPLKRFYRDRHLLTEIEGVGTPDGILAVTRRRSGASVGAAAVMDANARDRIVLRTAAEIACIARGLRHRARGPRRARPRRAARRHHRRARPDRPRAHPGRAAPSRRSSATTGTRPSSASR